MAHQFKPVDRDAEMLLPHNMLDWVPEGHAVRVVIGTVERLMGRDLIDRLVPATEKGSASGPARYDPVMLVTVWMYGYLRGVLSTRAVEDRCRYDATFRVACGRDIPDHTTFSRFRRHLFAQDGLAEELFYQVLHVCACAGLGRLSVAAADGVKIAASASREASRTEAGLRRLAAQVMTGARDAATADEADRPVLAGTDLLLDADTVPGPGPRSPWPPRSCGWRRPSRQRRPRSRPGRRAAPPGSGSPARRWLPAPARRPARPAPGWANCRHRPKPAPPAAGRKSRGHGATSPTRTPGCCRSAAAGSSRDTTARTPPPMTGSCSAATPARTPATCCRPGGSPPWRKKAPRSSPPPTPPTLPAPACSRRATTGCARCPARTRTARTTTPQPAMPP